MVHDNLGEMPMFEVGDGLSVHWYEPGDEKLWIEIHELADKLNVITPELFAEQFGDPDLDLHGRV